jgi:hypothetical protein
MPDMISSPLPKIMAWLRTCPSAPAVSLPFSRGAFVR